MAEQMDGQLFTYTTKLDKCKLSFYLPNETLTNYINIEHKINLRHLHLRQIQFIVGLNLLFTTFQGCIFRNYEFRKCLRNLEDKYNVSLALVTTHSREKLSRDA